MKWGVNAWAFPPTWSLEEACRTAAGAGFGGLELNLDEAGFVRLDASPADIQHIRRTIEAAGLAVVSVCTGLLWRHPLTDPDPAVRAQGLDIVRQMIHTAADLGTDAILVVPGLVTPEVPYDTAYQRAQGSLHELAPQAEAAGVQIGVENVWNRFLLSPLEMVRFLDEIGEPAVGAYFDVGNVLVNGYPEQWIRLLGRRVVRVHLKDFKLEIGNIHGFVDLLEGDVNWPAVREALQAVGYDGWLTLEQRAYRHAPAELLRRSAVAMRAVFG